MPHKEPLMALKVFLGQAERYVAVCAMTFTINAICLSKSDMHQAQNDCKYFLYHSVLIY